MCVRLAVRAIVVLSAILRPFLAAELEPIMSWGDSSRGRQLTRILLLAGCSLNSSQAYCRNQETFHCLETIPNAL